MDWDELRYVLAVHRERTLTEAAAQLGVTRTTVGRRIKAAEDRLGVRLFDRTPEGFAPTAEGEALAEAALRVEETVLAAEGQVRGRDAELRGRLRVSTVNFLFDGFPEVFSSFLQRYPRVDLTVQTADEQVSLMRREADVVIRLGNAPSEHLVGSRLGRLHFELYAARSLIARLGEGRPLQDYPWIHWDERADTRWLDRWLEEHAPGAEVAVRACNYEVMRRMLLMGVGVHFLPVFDGARRPELVSLGVQLTEQARDVWALTLPDLRRAGRIRAFLEHARGWFRERLEQ